MANIADTEVSLEKYVLDYARGFIPLMRDRAGAVPDTFLSDGHYVSSLKSSTKELAKLKAMTAKQRASFGERERKNQIKFKKERIAENQLDRVLIEDRIAQVKAWKVPSKRHEALKRYILERLELGIEDPVRFSDGLKRIESTPIKDFWKNAYADAKRDVRYYTKKVKEEEKNYALTNLWVKQLRDSLKESK